MQNFSPKSVVIVGTDLYPKVAKIQNVQQTEQIAVDVLILPQNIVALLMIQPSLNLTEEFVELKNGQESKADTTQEDNTMTSSKTNVQMLTHGNLMILKAHTNVKTQIIE